MIQLIDQAIEQFLRTAVPLPEGSVDLSFDAPDKTWGAAVTRPTVNVFLWDIKRNSTATQAGMTQRRDAAGQVERQQPPVAIDLRYLITAWASDRRDEHELLGALLRCVLRHSVLPADIAADLPDDVGPVRMALATSDRDTPDFWSALDGRMKPGIEIDLTMAVDVLAPIPAGPPVRRAELGVVPVVSPPPNAAAASNEVGTLRRSRQGGRLIAEGRAAVVRDSNGSDDSEPAQS